MRYYLTMSTPAKTPTRTIRVPDDLWKAVQKKAASEKVTVTSVIIAALERFLVDKA
jgi:hypothetical protein